MQKEDQLKNRLEAIESQVFHVRILLLIFMFLWLLGLRGISISIDKLRVGIGFLIVLLYLIFEVVTFYRRKKRIDQELKKIMDNLESDKEKPLS